MHEVFSTWGPSRSGEMGEKPMCIPTQGFYVVLSDYLFNAGPTVSSFSKVSMSTTKKMQGTYYRYRQNVSTREVCKRIYSAVICSVCTHFKRPKSRFLKSFSRCYIIKVMKDTNSATPQMNKQKTENMQTDTSPTRITKGTNSNPVALIGIRKKKKKFEPPTYNI